MNEWFERRIFEKSINGTGGKYFLKKMLPDNH